MMQRKVLSLDYMRNKGETLDKIFGNFGKKRSKFDIGWELI